MHSVSFFFQNNCSKIFHKRKKNDLTKYSNRKSTLSSAAVLVYLLLFKRSGFEKKKSFFTKIISFNFTSAFIILVLITRIKI